MPTTSIAEALAWYRRHTRPRDQTRTARSLPAFFTELVDVVRDAVYHFFPDAKPEVQVDALVGDILLYCRDYAAEVGCDFIPNIEREVRARFRLSDHQKKAADKRAERRWHDRGGGPTIDLFEPAPPGLSAFAGLVWTEKGRREIDRYKK
jgi:hypothetical protein